MIVDVFKWKRGSVVLVIILLSLNLISATVIEPGTICELTHANISFNKNFTVDNFYCLDNFMTLENSSMYQGNFTISVLSNTTPTNITLYDINNSIYVNFSALNTSAGTQGNFSIGLYQNRDTINIYHDEILDNGLSGSVANTTGFINFNWNFVEEENFELEIYTTTFNIFIDYVSGGFGSGLIRATFIIVSTLAYAGIAISSIIFIIIGAIVVLSILSGGGLDSDDIGSTIKVLILVGVFLFVGMFLLSTLSTPIIGTSHNNESSGSMGLTVASFTTANTPISLVVMRNESQTMTRNDSFDNNGCANVPCYTIVDSALGILNVTLRTLN